jgi:hypothetical protein
MVSVKDFKDRDYKKGISGRVFGYATTLVDVAACLHPLYISSRLFQSFRRPSFRRTGPSSIINIAVVTFVGVVSGNYIFGEPLRQYWEEQAKLEAQAKAQGEPIPAPRRRPAE